MRLALFQPDIPQNLGANLRLAACLGVAVDIIEPCGFPLTDRALKRTAMDYGENVAISRHSGWSAFRGAQVESGARLILFTTRGSVRLEMHAFQPGDILLFGRESARGPGRGPRRRRLTRRDTTGGRRALTECLGVCRHSPVGGASTNTPVASWLTRTWPGTKPASTMQSCHVIVITALPLVDERAGSWRHRTFS